MKITIKTISDFEPYLGIDETADKTFDFIVENGDLYDDDDDIKKTIDKGLELLNKIANENNSSKNETKSNSDDKPKSVKKSSKSKNTTPKKPSKPKVGEAAPWQKALRTFANMCGKERTINYIRKFVREIQFTFNAKLNQKTPNIELIREIQTKLIPHANNMSSKKITLPKWEDLQNKCRLAAREWSVSKSVPKSEISETALSGLKKKTKSKKIRSKNKRKK